MADPIQIHQVLMNLCTNAGHSMREGGLLQVDLVDVELDSDYTDKYPKLEPGDYLRLTVSDTGHGMPSHVVERVFDPFFTTKGKEQGTGMGLSVVHGIIENYGGTINVYSEPEKGSSFSVFLPAIEERAGLKKMIKNPVPKGTERILFVDDEKPLVDMGKRVLESLGYNVTARTNGIEAMECFKSKPDRFDLVITDMTMPKMTGVELAIDLMQVKPDIPIILCTGFSASIDENRAKAMGVKAFVFKPILKQDMAMAVRSVLDTR
jgi:CheY-like chemotaxis protein